MDFVRNQLVALATELSTSADRPAAIRNLSLHLGVESFIIFIQDPELNILLPAPGFPQTLPSGKQWRAFLNQTLQSNDFEGELLWNGKTVLAQGIAGAHGNAAVFLGNRLSPQMTHEFALFLPLLVAALNGERAVATCLSQTELAQQTAQQASELAERLDASRRAAQREIAARVKAEDEVRRANATLEKRVAERTQSLTQALAQLEEFSYTVAHDLRAPLRSITSFAEILQEDYRAHLPPEALEYLKRIIESGARMNQLTVDVISFARVTRAEFPITPLDLDVILEDILIQFKYSTTDLTIKVKRPLGSVFANELLLGQCVNNLLDNAAKYGRRDGKLTLDIWAEAQDGIVRLNFKDNGGGIAPQYQDRIFKIFERVETSKPGTGIGLAIVKRAVERMNGKIGVVSAPQEGSTFWIALKKA